MFRNYFKITLRNLYRQKVFSFINITGLAIGMAGVILISIYIKDELSYDRFHSHANRIYRVTLSRDGTAPDYAGTPSLLAPALKEKFPEVEDFVRIDPFAFKRKHLITYQDKVFYEDRFILADPSIFKVFDFKLLKGSPETILDEPNDLVLTQSLARKYFGEEDPLGKTMMYDGGKSFQVSGIMEDVPENSHLRFDLVASYTFINELKQWNTNLLTSWGISNFYSYLLLKKDTDPRELESKGAVLLREMTNNPQIKIFLQPIPDIHLRSTDIRDMESHGSIINVYFYSAIAVIILLVACINFMNLYTANSEVRAREIGIRKVVGAQKKQLIFQFLGEAILLTLIALPVALLLGVLALPFFNQVTGKSLEFLSVSNFPLFLGMVLMTVVVGFISGIYPALFISSFQPVKILRGKLNPDGGRVTLRNILVILQFTVTILFIGGTLIVQNQMDFIRNKKLGYDRENIINVPVYSPETRERYNIFREEIIRHPYIADATATSFTPSIERWRQGMYFEGRKETDDHMFYMMAGDYNLIDLFGMKIIAGRSFNRQTPSDLENAWILNESAVREIGWTPEEAIGKSFGSRTGQIIGIVKDFHFRSLRNETKPMAIGVMPGSFKYISIKIVPGEEQNTVRFLKRKWDEVNPGYPFEYFFYDNEFDKLYKAENKLGIIFRYFTILTICIACMGLFGLSLFAVQRKIKEIGIRKVMGADVSDIILLLTRNFVKLILFGYCISIPVMFFIMNKWLQGFAYRTKISPLTFIFSGILALGVALITVSVQVIKAARSNPVDVLKYE